MQLMTVSAAARHLGYKSRSQLYRLMNDGWLDAHVHVQMPSGQRLLDVDGLQKTLQGLCQWRNDSVFLRNSLPYKVSIALNGNSVYAALRCSMGVKSHPIGD